MDQKGKKYCSIWRISYSIPSEERNLLFNARTRKKNCRLYDLIENASLISGSRVLQKVSWWPTGRATMKSTLETRQYNLGPISTESDAFSTTRQEKQRTASDPLIYDLAPCARWRPTVPKGGRVSVVDVTEIFPCSSTIFLNFGSSSLLISMSCWMSAKRLSSEFLSRFIELYQGTYCFVFSLIRVISKWNKSSCFMISWMYLILLPIKANALKRYGRTKWQRRWSRKKGEGEGT